MQIHYFIAPSYIVFHFLKCYNKVRKHLLCFLLPQGIKTPGAVGGQVRMPVVITQSVRAQGMKSEALSQLLVIEVPLTHTVLLFLDCSFYVFE